MKNTSVTPQQLAMLRSDEQHLLAKKLSSSLPRMSAQHEALARMVIDPAHLAGASNGPLFPDNRTMGKAACRVQVQETVLTIPADSTLAVYSLPFFETPYGYRHEDGSPLIAVPNRMATSSTNVADWLKDNKVYGWRTTAKSLSIHNVTPQIQQGGALECARFNVLCDFYKASPSGFSLAGAAGTLTTEINNRVLQGLPGSPSEVSMIPTYQTLPSAGGVYLVNKLQDESWRFRTDAMQKAFSDGSAPGVGDLNSILLWKDLSAGEHTPGSYAEYKANSSPYTDSTRVRTSMWDGTDMTVMVTKAPAGAPQTFVIRMVMVTEFLPKMDSTTFIYELKDRSLDTAFLEQVRRFANKELGIYPVCYNDWSAIWNKFKSWASNIRDFYKDHSKILKPALSLIPGVGTALEVVDKYI